MLITTDGGVDGQLGMWEIQALTPNNWLTSSPSRTDKKYTSVVSSTAPLNTPNIEGRL